MKNAITIVITIIGFLVMFSGTILGIYKFNECHDARADALNILTLKFDYWSESDYLKEMRPRYWQLDKRCSKGQCTPEEEQEWKQLKEDIDLQLEKVKELQKQLQQNRGKSG